MKQLKGIFVRIKCKTLKIRESTTVLELNFKLYWRLRFEFFNLINISRSSRPEVFLGKGVLKTYSKVIGEHPCQSVISIKLQSTFIEITLRHGCSQVNLLHIFRTPFLKNASGWLLRKKHLTKENVFLHYF